VGASVDVVAVAADRAVGASVAVVVLAADKTVSPRISTTCRRVSRACDYNATAFVSDGCEYPHSSIFGCVRANVNCAVIKNTTRTNNIAFSVIIGCDWSC